LCDAINQSIHTPLFLLLGAINSLQQKGNAALIKVAWLIATGGKKIKRESRAELFDPFGFLA
jgi:hypothetical protein